MFGDMVYKSPFGSDFVWVTFSQHVALHQPSHREDDKVILSGQIITTSADVTPNGGEK